MVWNIWFGCDFTSTESVLLTSVLSVLSIYITVSEQENRKYKECCVLTADILTEGHPQNKPAQTALSQQMTL